MTADIISLTWSNLRLASVARVVQWFAPMPASRYIVRQNNNSD